MIEQRIKNVLASVLAIDPSEIRDDSCSSSVANWDSVKQIMLVLSLEDEFGVHFSDEQTVELHSYAAIKRTVEDALKAQS